MVDIVYMYQIHRFLFIYSFRLGGKARVTAQRQYQAHRLCDRTVLPLQSARVVEEEGRPPPKLVSSCLRILTPGNSTSSFPTSCRVREKLYYGHHSLTSISDTLPDCPSSTP